MIDERYDRSADMRLLDLHRAALGVPARIIDSVAYADSDSPTEMVNGDERPYVPSGTVLIAAIDAQPRSALIPGALVTVSLSVLNDGSVRAGSVRLSLPLPVSTAYRPGTLAIDNGVGAEAAAHDLFGIGTEIGDIAPGTRRTLMVKLLIEPGVGDIVLSPHLTAASGAVLGLRALRLTRAGAVRNANTIDRPFYESDEAEHTREPLPPPATLPTITVLQPREYPPALAPATAPSPAPAAAPAPAAKGQTDAAKRPAPKSKPKPRPKPKAKVDAPPVAAARSPKASVRESVALLVAEPVVVPSAKPIAATKIVPTKIEVVRSVEDRISITARGGPILTVRIDRKRLATLTRLFSGPSLGMIAHYLVLNALATKDGLPADGTDGAIATFVANQERLLSRALIAMRLGKTPAPESVGAALPAFPPAFRTHIGTRAIDAPSAGEAILARAFETSEIVFLERMLSNAKAPAFLRAAQLFVGLCANDAVVTDEPKRRQAGVALAAYAALATAEISRIFLRAKISGNPALFKATDTTFDDAARTVLVALGRSIG